MAAAIKEFGFRIPIVGKSDGLVIDGHLRLKAARKLGMTMVPVALADELTDTQIKAFRLLANRSANWAQWDDDLLRLELTDLRDMGIDLGLTGFGDDALTALLGGKPSGDPDEVPETPVTHRQAGWHRHTGRDGRRKSTGRQRARHASGEGGLEADHRFAQCLGEIGLAASFAVPGVEDGLGGPPQFRGCGRQGRGVGGLGAGRVVRCRSGSPATVPKAARGSSSR